MRLITKTRVVQFITNGCGEGLVDSPHPGKKPGQTTNPAVAAREVPGEYSLRHSVRNRCAMVANAHYRARGGGRRG